MKKTIKFLLLFFHCGAAVAQINGNLVSIYPDSAPQGQTLITTITVPTDYVVLASPPCSPNDIMMIQGSDSIFSTQYFFYWPDYFEVEFTIPPNASPGYYDVYLSGSYYDWNGCNTNGYWVLFGGFHVTSVTNLAENDQMPIVKISPNPFYSTGIISFDNFNNRQFRLKVFDGMGNETKTIFTMKSSINLYREDFNPGIYFYRLDDPDKNTFVSGRFIVLE